MSTGTDYLSALAVELISKIISFQDYVDRERCRFLSKFLHKIYKSTRTDFTVGLHASRPTVGLRVNSFVDKDKLDISLLALYHPNTISIEAYLRAFKVVELKIIHCHCSTLNTLFINKFSSLFIRHMTVEGVELDSLRVLPTLAPNLESLILASHTGELFTGTEPFTNLKTLSFRSHMNVWPLISSITKAMPSLTGLITGVNESRRATNFFVTPKNLQYIDLYLGKKALFPISATNALTQLHLRSYGGVAIGDIQPAPLSNVEIFGFIGEETSLYPTMEYYGIGNNLKILSLDTNDLDRNWASTEMRDRAKPLDEIFNKDQVWKRCSNLECLLVEGDVQIKTLVHVTSICTKLRLVSFDRFLEDNGEFNTQLLSKTGIKDISLRSKLPDEELKFLLDSGIDIVYGSERLRDPHEWQNRRCLSSLLY